jgi:hypothetical protein
MHDDLVAREVRVVAELNEIDFLLVHDHAVPRPIITTDLADEAQTTPAMRRSLTRCLTAVRDGSVASVEVQEPVAACEAGGGDADGEADNQPEHDPFHVSPFANEQQYGASGLRRRSKQSRSGHPSSSLSPLADLREIRRAKRD